MRRPPEIKDLPKYPVTGGTCLLALGATLAWWAKVDMSPLMDGVEVRQGQVWRLATSALLHGDMFHLLFNLMWTWSFGTLVEQVWGHARTLAIFLLLAVGSGAAEFAFLDGGVGLSGVGYGLFGLLWVMSRRDRRFADAVDGKTVNLFVVWFFLCIVLTVASVWSVANIAHGVGALIGLLLGWAIVLPDRRRQAAATAAIVVLVPAFVGAATFARPYVNLSSHRGEEEAYLGYQALMANRNVEAVRWCREASRMRPGDAGNWLNLGIAYERTGREDEAEEAYKRSTELKAVAGKSAD